MNLLLHTVNKSDLKWNIKKIDELKIIKLNRRLNLKVVKNGCHLFLVTLEIIGLLDFQKKVNSTLNIYSVKVHYFPFFMNYINRFKHAKIFHLIRSCLHFLILSLNMNWDITFQWTMTLHRIYKSKQITSKLPSKAFILKSLKLLSSHKLTVIIFFTWYFWGCQYPDFIIYSVT